MILFLNPVSFTSSNVLGCVAFGLTRRDRIRSIMLACVVVVMCGAASQSSAQGVVYETLRPVQVMPSMQPNVANYTPAGNYAAVTAFSPPVVVGYSPQAVAVASYFPPANAQSAMSVGMPVTSYYSPATAYYAPTTAYYAPTTAYYAPTTAYYAPTTAYYAPALALPVTAYYPPAYYAPAMPLYRRGIFGGYRPVRGVYGVPAY